MCDKRNPNICRKKKYFLLNFGLYQLTYLNKVIRNYIVFNFHIILMIGAVDQSIFVYLKEIVNREISITLPKAIKRYRIQ